MIDATHRRNRFNLPTVTILEINNYGKNIVLGFALISKETIESYKWVFEQLKKAWKTQKPQTFICDECPSINEGLY